MYRGDQKPKPKAGVRLDVIEFFHAERKALNGDMQCSRIGTLSPRIVPFLEPYDPRRIDAYLAPVKHSLESRVTPSSYVVFLDPDTGIREKPGPEHVCPRLLASVWKSMLAGDTLLIYQHRAREKFPSWLLKKTELIARAIQAASSDVTCKQHSGVCFFIIRKKKQPRD